MFNFWWSAGLVNGLKPHLPPLSSQKNKILVFGLCSTSDDWPRWSIDLNPVCLPSPVKKMKCSCFRIMFNFWWSAGLVNGLKPHLPPLSSQKKNKMLVFGLCSTSDDQPGWSVDSNPLHPSPVKKMKCLFSDYVQLLAGLFNGLKPHLPPLPSQKNKILVFGLCSTSDDQPGWSVDSNPLCYPSPVKKMKCLFLDYVQLLMIGQAGRCTRTPSATPLQSKK